MRSIQKKVLFLGKKADPAATRAEARVRGVFADVDAYFGSFGDPFPESLNEWKGDWIISYLCPWVIPGELLKKATVAAINFHPGPPEYPGIGCTNFAIYDEKAEFGVTVHHMSPRVDSGGVIAVRRFSVMKSDTVLDVTRRCYEAIETLFEQVIQGIASGDPLPVSKEHWTRKPYTRKELNDLCRLTPEMSPEEMLRRIRAVTFPGKPGAYLELNGKKFNLTETN